MHKSEKLLAHIRKHTHLPTCLCSTHYTHWTGPNPVWQATIEGFKCHKEYHFIQTFYFRVTKLRQPRSVHISTEYLHLDVFIVRRDSENRKQNRESEKEAKVTTINEWPFIGDDPDRRKGYWLWTQSSTKNGFFGAGIGSRSQQTNCLIPPNTLHNVGRFPHCGIHSFCYTDQGCQIRRTVLNKNLNTSYFHEISKNIIETLNNCKNWLAKLRFD